MTDNRKDAESLVAAYEALVQRAVAILNGDGPPWGYIGNPEWARLSFDGADVVVSHPEADSYYDSLSISTDAERFPAALLFMPDAELAAWKKDAKAKYEAGQAELRKQRIAAQEAEERRAYEALRKKFGDGQSGEGK